MPDISAIVSVVIGVVGVIIAYKQLIRTPILKKVEDSEKGGTNNLLHSILNNKIIRVGYYHYPPFVYANKDNNSPTGFFPRVIEQIAKEKSVEVAWEAVTFSDAVQTINSKRVDMIVAIFETPKRREKVDFTACLHSVSVGGVSKKSLPTFHRPTDLVNSNKSIVVSKEEIGHELAQTFRINRSRLTIIDTHDLSKIVSYVELGHADVALLDGVSIINYFENVNQNKNSLKPIFRREPLAVCPNGVMIAKNEPDFAEWLDKECRRVRQYPDIKQFEDDMLERYHGVMQPV